jgi:hypothetical protein
VEFVVSANDPLDARLMYSVTLSGGHHLPAFQEENTFEWTPTTIGVDYSINFWIRSPRVHRAHQYYDDTLMVQFDVLPPKDTA